MTPKAVAFGVLMLVPVILYVLVALAIFDVFDPPWLEFVFESRRGFFLVSTVGVVGLIVYVIDVWRNPRMPPDKRALWTVVLLATNLYAMPFYFWFYVRPTKGSGGPPRTPSSGA